MELNRGFRRHGLAAIVFTATAAIGGACSSGSAAMPPLGMIRIPGGTFHMGCADCGRPDAEPVHLVAVDPFWMDETPVTNKQFAAFVAATGYVTIAERIPDAQDYPGVPVDKLVPGSACFRPSAGPVPLDNPNAWWTYQPGASWKRPNG